MDEAFDPDEFWGSPGNRPFKLSEQQALFCIALMQGMTQTEAGAAAGYSDPGAGGTHASRSPKVKAALEAFKAAEAGMRGPITSEEIIEHLTDEVRHGHGQSRINAGKVLLEVEKSKDPIKQLTDGELLTMMCNMDLEELEPPFMTAFALVYKKRISRNYPDQLRGWNLSGDSIKKLTTHPDLVAILERESVPIPDPG